MSQQGLPEECWCELLGTAQLAINSAIWDSKDVSPYKLVFGQELRLPINIMVGTDGNVLVEDLIQQQCELLDTVCASLKRAQEYQTMFANHYRHKEEFAMGDQVLLDASNLSIPGVHKLRQRFYGSIPCYSSYW